MGQWNFNIPKILSMVWISLRNVVAILLEILSNKTKRGLNFHKYHKIYKAYDTILLIDGLVNMDNLTNSAVLLLWTHPLSTLRSKYVWNFSGASVEADILPISDSCVRCSRYPKRRRKAHGLRFSYNSIAKCWVVYS